MPTIRTRQFARLALAQEESFLRDMAAHLRAHFPDVVAGLDDAALLRNVTSGVAQARAFGLSTSRDLSRFLNLLAASGWTFAREPEHAWMRSYLEDHEVSDPGARLDRLVRAFKRRRQVDAKNAELREEFGV